MGAPLNCVVVHLLVSCKVTNLMKIIPPRQLSRFLDGFKSELREAREDSYS